MHPSGFGHKAHGEKHISAIHSSPTPQKIFQIVHVFRPEDAQTLLTIVGDFEFDSLEMSDTKKFFVLFKEYLHAVIDNQQMYVQLSFIY